MTINLVTKLNEAKVKENEVFRGDGRLRRNIEREDSEEFLPVLEKCRIGLIGISPGAGVSLLTMTLAKAISAYGLVPAVLELGSGGIYDAIGIDGRFSSREFFSFHKAVQENRKIRNRTNFDEGINWALFSPEYDAVPLETTKMMRLIDNICGEVILCDFSGVDIVGYSGTLFNEMLKDLDGLITVIDPLPSRMLAGYNQLQVIKSISPDIVYVVNKANRGVNRREMLNFLGIKNPVFLPYLPAEELYESEYNCRIAYGNVKIKKIINDYINEIIKRAVPPELLKL